MKNNKMPEYYEDEVELIDHLRVLWKWKVFILLTVVLCAGAAIGITMVKYPTKYITECIIALNFPGIEKHRNPDDTLFDKNHIIARGIERKRIFTEISTVMRRLLTGYAVSYNFRHRRHCERSKGIK
jgi:hypothetical protein